MDMKPNVDRDADAGIMLADFSRRSAGDIITYEDIEKLIGWDIRRNRAPLNKARKWLLEDYGKVLTVVRNVGYRISTSHQIVEEELRKEREHRRRSARKSKAKAAVVNLSELTEELQLKCHQERWSAYIMQEAGTAKSLKRLGAILTGAAEPLALNKALDALKHNV